MNLTVVLLMGLKLHCSFQFVSILWGDKRYMLVAIPSLLGLVIVSTFHYMSSRTVKVVHNPRVTIGDGERYLDAYKIRCFDVATDRVFSIVVLVLMFFFVVLGSAYAGFMPRIKGSPPASNPGKTSSLANVSVPYYQSVVKSSWTNGVGFAQDTLRAMLHSQENSIPTGPCSCGASLAQSQLHDSFGRIGCCYSLEGGGAQACTLEYPRNNSASSSSSTPLQCPLYSTWYLSLCSKDFILVVASSTSKLAEGEWEIEMGSRFQPMHHRKCAPTAQPTRAPTASIISNTSSSSSPSPSPSTYSPTAMPTTSEHVPESLRVSDFEAPWWIGDVRQLFRVEIACSCTALGPLSGLDTPSSVVRRVSEVYDSLSIYAHVELAASNSGNLTISKEPSLSSVWIDANHTTSACVQSRGSKSELIQVGATYLLDHEDNSTTLVEAISILRGQYRSFAQASRLKRTSKVFQSNLHYMVLKMTNSQEYYEKMALGYASLASHYVEDYFLQAPLELLFEDPVELSRAYPSNNVQAVTNTSGDACFEIAFQAGDPSARIGLVFTTSNTLLSQFASQNMAVSGTGVALMSPIEAFRAVAVSLDDDAASIRLHPPATASLALKLFVTWKASYLQATGGARPRSDLFRYVRIREQDGGYKVPVLSLSQRNATIVDADTDEFSLTMVAHDTPRSRIRLTITLFGAQAAVYIATSSQVINSSSSIADFAHLAGPSEALTLHIKGLWYPGTNPFATVSMWISSNFIAVLGIFWLLAAGIILANCLPVGTRRLTVFFRLTLCIIYLAFMLNFWLKERAYMCEPADLLEKYLGEGEASTKNTCHMEEKDDSYLNFITVPLILLLVVMAAQALFYFVGFVAKISCFTTHDRDESLLSIVKFAFILFSGQRTLANTLRSEDGGFRVEIVQILLDLVLFDKPPEPSHELGRYFVFFLLYSSGYLLFARNYYFHHRFTWHVIRVFIVDIPSYVLLWYFTEKNLDRTVENITNLSLLAIIVVWNLTSGMKSIFSTRNGTGVMLCGAMFSAASASSLQLYYSICLFLATTSVVLCESAGFLAKAEDWIASYCHNRIHVSEIPIDFLLFAGVQSIAAMSLLGQTAAYFFTSLTGACVLVALALWIKGVKRSKATGLGALSEYRDTLYKNVVALMIRTCRFDPSIWVPLLITSMVVVASVLTALQCEHDSPTVCASNGMWVAQFLAYGIASGIFFNSTESVFLPARDPGKARRFSSSSLRTKDAAARSSQSMAGFGSTGVELAKLSASPLELQEVKAIKPTQTRRSFDPKAIVETKGSEALSTFPKHTVNLPTESARMEGGGGGGARGMTTDLPCGSENGQMTATPTNPMKDTKQPSEEDSKHSERSTVEVTLTGGDLQLQPPPPASDNRLADEKTREAEDRKDIPPLHSSHVVSVRPIDAKSTKLSARAEAKHDSVVSGKPTTIATEILDRSELFVNDEPSPNSFSTVASLSNKAAKAEWDYRGNTRNRVESQAAIRPVPVRANIDRTLDYRCLNIADAFRRFKSWIESTETMEDLGYLGYRFQAVEKYVSARFHPELMQLDARTHTFYEGTLPLFQIRICFFLVVKFWAVAAVLLPSYPILVPMLRFPGGFDPVIQLIPYIYPTLKTMPSRTAVVEGEMGGVGSPYERVASEMALGQSSRGQEHLRRSTLKSFETSTAQQTNSSIQIPRQHSSSLSAQSDMAQRGCRKARKRRAARSASTYTNTKDHDLEGSNAASSSTSSASRSNSSMSRAVSSSLAPPSAGPRDLRVRRKDAFFLEEKYAHVIFSAFVVRLELHPLDYFQPPMVIVAAFAASSALLLVCYFVGANIVWWIGYYVRECFLNDLRMESSFRYFPSAERYRLKEAGDSLAFHSFGWLFWWLDSFHGVPFTMVSDIIVAQSFMLPLLPSLAALLPILSFYFKYRADLLALRKGKFPGGLEELMKSYTPTSVPRIITVAMFNVLVWFWIAFWLIVVFIVASAIVYFVKPLNAAFREVFSTTVILYSTLIAFHVLLWMLGELLFYQRVSKGFITQNFSFGLLAYATFTVWWSFAAEIMILKILATAITACLTIFSPNRPASYLRVLRYMDMGYYAYHSALIHDHTHNNPHVIVFASIVANIVAKNRLRLKAFVADESWLGNNVISAPHICDLQMKQSTKLALLRCQHQADESRQGVKKINMFNTKKMKRRNTIAYNVITKLRGTDSKRSRLFLARLKHKRTKFRWHWIVLLSRHRHVLHARRDYIVQRRRRVIDAIRMNRHNQPQEISVSSKALTEEDLVEIAAAVQGNDFLKKIDLSKNPLGPSSAYVIAQIVINSDLLELNLDWTDLGDEGIDHLCSALRNSGHRLFLKKLSVAGNRITDRGARSLLSLIKSTPSLVEVRIDTKSMFQPCVGSTVIACEGRTSKWHIAQVVSVDCARKTISVFARDGDGNVDEDSKRLFSTSVFDNHYNFVRKGLKVKIEASLASNQKAGEGEEGAADKSLRNRRFGVGLKPETAFLFVPVMLGEGRNHEGLLGKEDGSERRTKSRKRPVCFGIYHGSKVLSVLSKSEGTVGFAPPVFAKEGRTPEHKTRRLHGGRKHELRGLEEGHGEFSDVVNVYDKKEEGAKGRGVERVLPSALSQRRRIGKLQSHQLWCISSRTERGRGVEQRYASYLSSLEKVTFRATVSLRSAQTKKYLTPIFKDGSIRASSKPQGYMQEITLIRGGSSPTESLFHMVGSYGAPFEVCPDTSCLTAKRKSWRVKDIYKPGFHKRAAHARTLAKNSKKRWDFGSRFDRTPRVANKAEDRKKEASSQGDNKTDVSKVKLMGR
eukprot:jgi/Bigna1/90801/estExt_fgenesh1_pg.C_790089